MGRAIHISNNNNPKWNQQSYNVPGLDVFSAEYKDFILKLLIFYSLFLNRAWQFIHQNFLKKGALLVTVPSIQESLMELQEINVRSTDLCL